MARRRGWMAERERQRLRAQQPYERTVRQAAREAERRKREQQRQEQAEAKERQRLYVEHRLLEVTEMNEELAARMQMLRSLLPQGLARDATFDLESLKDRSTYPPFVPPSHLAEPFVQPSRDAFMPPNLSGLRKLIPGQREKHHAAIAQGEAAYEAACSSWERGEQARLDNLARLRADHEAEETAHNSAIALQHRQVDQLAESYRQGDRDAVANYYEAVLAVSPYPDDFPHTYRVAYIPESRQVVIDYDLPPFDVVPEDASYTYVKAHDTVTPKKGKATDRRELYSAVVSAITLRTLHEVFQADKGQHVDVVVFSGHVNTIDPSTGRDIRPCLLSVRTSRDEFTAVDLSRIDPIACVRHLKAQISRSPAELVPVRPIIEFDMVDPRFIEHGDVLSTLDQRPNIMELTPGEFEGLVTNLFESMGLETKLTQPSRDGGVDCVAYDPRPVLGGKVVVQAKRYRNTVGVSAVRDLFGTVHNEGASKGILVTTSDFGRAAFEFANGKPLELINGSNLLYLLSQCGVEAKIEIPDDWVDPAEVA